MADGTPTNPPTARDFDAWYAAMAASPAKDDLVRRHLGQPPEMLGSGLLGWDVVEEITRFLLLGPGEVLLDLACGRGGYGLEVARRTGSGLVGVDFSPVALEAARADAERQGLRADFRLGAMESTGLEDACVDGLICVDAVQLSSTPSTAYAEMRRVLRPGGRILLTSWQALDPDDASLPLRLRQLDLRTGLQAVGFLDVEVHVRPEWLARERGLWEEAVTLEPGEDRALADLRDEAERVLATYDSFDRVVATAVAPEG